MADNQEMPLIFITIEEPLITSYFYRLACDTPSKERNKYNIIALKWYKQPFLTSITKHEFVVAKVKWVRNDCVFFLVVE